MNKPRKDKPRSARRQLVDYLNELGIERLADKESVDRFVAKGKGVFGRGLRRLISTGLIWRIRFPNMPYYHDLSQGFPLDYDYRMSFLPELARMIDKKPQSVVVDAGCGTGLDLCFLAKLYEDEAVDFIGYDKSRSMIAQANRRKERLGLANVDFYVSNHEKPGELELNRADLIYANSSLTSGGVERSQRSIEGIRERMKEGGIYVQAGHRKPISDELKELYLQMGMQHEREKWISTFNPSKGKYYESKQMNDKRKAMMAKHLPEKVRFYMDVFKKTGF